eukprot:11199005-Karenia_brevis.AAC.1
MSAADAVCVETLALSKRSKSIADVCYDGDDHDGDYDDDVDYDDNNGDDDDEDDDDDDDGDCDGKDD